MAEEFQQPFAKGEINPYSKFFTGRTYLNMLVTSGEGRYQEKGKEVQILKKGDVVKIPPNVEHWHGASPNSEFSHISIEPNLPNNQTTWLDAVSDKEYK